MKAVLVDYGGSTVFSLQRISLSPPLHTLQLLAVPLLPGPRDVLLQGRSSQALLPGALPSSARRFRAGSSHHHHHSQAPELPLPSQTLLSLLSFLQTKVEDEM